MDDTAARWLVATQFKDSNTQTGLAVMGQNLILNMNGMYTWH